MSIVELEKNVEVPLYREVLNNDSLVDGLILCGIKVLLLVVLWVAKLTEKSEFNC